jgi:hypothetical protein
MTAGDVVASVRITDVAQALGVLLDRARRRGVATWRKGKNFSVSFNDAKNVWHDFVTNEGGVSSISLSKCSAAIVVALLTGFPI